MFGVREVPSGVENQFIDINNILENTWSVQGICWNELTDTYTKVGTDVPLAQESMKRCVVDENGAFLYYLDANNSALKADGTDATADIEGLNGTRQVMVQIKKFYMLRYAVGANHYHLVSPYEFAGSECHTLFRKSGWIENDDTLENDYYYTSAFEGCWYDASASSFIDNNKANDNTGNIDLANDKIMSIAGKKPYSGITIVEGRQLIENGGSKQYHFHVWDAVNLLSYIELGSFNSQENIPGFTSGGTIDTIAPTGLTLSLGNNSGSITNSESQVAGVGTTVVVANSYRGIENFYGHLWKFCDAINIQDGKPFVCGADDVFESNKFDGQYTQAKDSSDNLIQMPTASGYITKIHSGGFFTKENIGGNSGTKLTDYYWYSAGNRVLLSGGLLNNGGYVGSFCWYGNFSSGTSRWYIAVRS